MERILNEKNAGVQANSDEHKIFSDIWAKQELQLLPTEKMPLCVSVDPYRPKEEHLIPKYHLELPEGAAPKGSEIQCLEFGAVTANGDEVRVKADGTVKLSGDVKTQTQDKQTGEMYIEFRDGETVIVSAGKHLRFADSKNLVPDDQSCGEETNAKIHPEEKIPEHETILETLLRQFKERKNKGPYPMFD